MNFNKSLFGQLPPLEEVTRNGVTKSSYSKEGTEISKPLKLSKCPSSFIDKKGMFWIEPLGLWVPLRQVRLRIVMKIQYTEHLSY